LIDENGAGAMPRYFLHVRDLKQTIDREGFDLPGPDEARTHALVAAGEAFWSRPELQIW